MSWIKPRGKKGVYVYYWFDGKTTRSKSLHTVDEDAAKEKKRIYDRQLEQSTGLTEKSFWKDFISEYLPYAETNKSEGTVVKEKHTIKKFESAVSPHRASSVTPHQIEMWRNQIAQDTSKATSNQHLRYMKAIFSKAVQWGYVAESPLKYIQQIPTEKRFPRFLSKKEIKALFEAAKKDRPDACLIVSLLIYTGMRRGELVALKWADVNLERGWIRAFGKGQRERYIPIFKRLRPYLKPQGNGYVLGNPLSKNTLYHTIKRLYRKAKIKGANVHTTRHTFASWAIMSGIDISTLKELLGHSSINVTQIYGSLSKNHIQDSIQKLRL